MLRMRSIRHWRLPIAALTACAAVGFFVARPAGAATKGVDAGGTVACAMTGKVRFAPGLRTNGSAPTVKVTLTAKLDSCTGTSDGAQVTTGKLKATGTITTNDCATFATAGLPQMQVKVKWKTAPGGPKLNPSLTMLTVSQPIVRTGGAIVLDSVGTNPATGSFHGATFLLHAGANIGSTEFSQSCDTRRGQRIVTFDPTMSSSARFLFGA